MTTIQSGMDSSRTPEDTNFRRLSTTPGIFSRRTGKHSVGNRNGKWIEDPTRECMAWSRRWLLNVESTGFLQEATWQQKVAPTTTSRDSAEWKTLHSSRTEGDIESRSIRGWVTEETALYDQTNHTYLHQSATNVLDEFYQRVLHHHRITRSILHGKRNTR